jgi:hypothetical protein
VQANNSAPTLYFNQPGYYMVKARLQTGTTTATTAGTYGGGNTTQYLSSLPPVWKSDVSFSNVHAQVASQTNVTIMNFNLIVDAQSGYVQGSTYIVLTGSVTLGTGQSWFSEMTVLKIPNPVNNVVPILPEITIMKQKYDAQESRIKKLEQYINNNDNNNSSYITINDDDAKLSLKNFVDENTSSILRRGDSILVGKSQSNKK